MGALIFFYNVTNMLHLQISECLSLKQRAQLSYRQMKVTVVEHSGVDNIVVNPVDYASIQESYAQLAVKSWQQYMDARPAIESAKTGVFRSRICNNDHEKLENDHYCSYEALQSFLVKDGLARVLEGGPDDWREPGKCTTWEHFLLC